MPPCIVRFRLYCSGPVRSNTRNVAGAVTDTQPGVRYLTDQLSRCHSIALNATRGCCGAASDGRSTQRNYACAAITDPHTGGDMCSYYPSWPDHSSVAHQHGGTVPIQHSGRDRYFTSLNVEPGAVSCCSTSWCNAPESPAYVDASGAAVHPLPRPPPASPMHAPYKALHSAWATLTEGSRACMVSCVSTLSRLAASLSLYVVAGP